MHSIGSRDVESREKSGFYLSTVGQELMNNHMLSNRADEAVLEARAAASTPFQRFCRVMVIMSSFLLFPRWPSLKIGQQCMNPQPPLYRQETAGSACEAERPTEVGRGRRQGRVRGFRVPRRKAQKAFLHLPCHNSWSLFSSRDWKLWPGLFHSVSEGSSPSAFLPSFFSSILPLICYI